MSATHRQILIAPDSFKSSATAADVAHALAQGWKSVYPADDVVELPLADGGEGTLDALAAGRTDACWHEVEVTGPDSRPVVARWLRLGDGTAAVELAQSSGLPQMEQLDALGAHTRGLGEVIAAALDTKPRRLLVGLGGSAGTDGGTGCLSALGARFTDADGQPIPLGGGGLGRLAHADLSALRPAPPDGVVCLTDVSAPLLGPAGAAAVFAPQKGATPAQVALLEQGLGRLHRVLGGDAEATGAGAAGGTAYGLRAAWGASTASGADEIAAAVDLTSAVSAADLVITGEGRFDATSLTGKVVGNLVDLAAAAGTPLAIVAGQSDCARTARDPGPPSPHRAGRQCRRGAA